MDGQSATGSIAALSVRTHRFGMEWLHSKTDWVVDVGLPTQREEERSGNQLIFSALYTF
jgi:hypothetical protein